MPGHRTIEDMRPLVEAFEAGTERRGAFAERTGIPVSTLDYWRRRCRESAFVEVHPDTLADGSTFDLTFASGARLSYSGPLDPALLIMLAERAR